MTLPAHARQGKSFGLHHSPECFAQESLECSHSLVGNTCPGSNNNNNKDKLQIKGNCLIQRK